MKEIEVNRNDIELITKIESMGTWEKEKYKFDIHNSYDIWGFDNKSYKIFKDSSKLV